MISDTSSSLWEAAHQQLHAAQLLMISNQLAVAEPLVGLPVIGNLEAPHSIPQRANNGRGGQEVYRQPAHMTLQCIAFQMVLQVAVSGGSHHIKQQTGTCSMAVAAR